LHVQAVVKTAFLYLLPASQQGIGQSSAGQGMSQQASVADVQDAVDAQQAPPEFAKEKAIPADSRMAALSAKTLFFMILNSV